VTEDGFRLDQPLACPSANRPNANRNYHYGNPHGLRLISLWLVGVWLVWLLAMLFPVDMGLMSPFHGQSPEIHSHVEPSALAWLLRAMLGYFLLPLIALVRIAYACTSTAPPQRWRGWRPIPGQPDRVIDGAGSEINQL
jgi:hypothetical protein